LLIEYWLAHFGPGDNFLKKLKEIGLVAHEAKVYDLSLLGKTIVRRMEPLITAIKLLEDNYD